MKIRGVIIIVVLIVTNVSCNKKDKFSSNQDIWDFIYKSPNGLYVESVHGNIIQEMFYMPSRFLDSNNMNKGYIYFKYKISSKNGPLLLNDYLREVNNENISITAVFMDLFSIKVNKNYFIQPVHISYSPLYGFVPYDELLLVFNTDEIVRNKKPVLIFDGDKIGLLQLFLEINIQNVQLIENLNHNEKNNR